MIKFDGIDLKKEYLVQVVEKTGAGGATKTVYDAEFDNLNGAIRYGYKYNKFTIGITFKVFSDNITNQTAQQKKNALIALFNRANSRQVKLEFDDRYLNVYGAENAYDVTYYDPKLESQVIDINVNFDVAGDSAYISQGWENESVVNGNGVFDALMEEQLFPSNIYSSNFILEAISNLTFQGKNFEIIETEGFIIIDSPYFLATNFTVDEYNGYGDTGYQWNLYTEGTGDGYQWDTTSPLTALTILTTDTVQDPSTALTIIDGGFIESSYSWSYNDPSTALEVQ